MVDRSSPIISEWGALQTQLGHRYTAIRLQRALLKGIAPSLQMSTSTLGGITDTRCEDFPAQTSNEGNKFLRVKHCNMKNRNEKSDFHSFHSLKVFLNKPRKRDFIPIGRTGTAFVLECSLSETFGHLLILPAGEEGPLNVCVTEELNVKPLTEGVMYFVCRKWFSSKQEGADDTQGQM